MSLRRCTRAVGSHTINIKNGCRATGPTELGYTRPPQVAQAVRFSRVGKDPLQVSSERSIAFGVHEQCRAAGHLGYRMAVRRDYWRATRHRFENGQAETLNP